MAFKPAEPPKRVADYLKSIDHDAQWISDLYKIPKELILSQACQESGYGTSDNCLIYCNHFGIQGGIYDNQIECFVDYARVLTLPCYDNLQPKTLDEWLLALECCNYAGDKNYTQSLRIIIEKYIKP